MKKVLIATDGFLPRWDGISSFLNEIIPRIQDDFELIIIAPNLGMPRKYKAKLIRFNTFKMRLGDNYYASKVNLIKMSKAIKKADCVWVQCLGPIGIFAILLSKLHKKPVVMYNHMIEWEVFPKSQGMKIMKVPINILTKFLGVRLYNMCNTIIVPSAEHAELLTLLGIRNAKKIVVHLGVDIKRFSLPNSRAEAKKKLGIEPSKFVVGYGGRVSLEKDLRTLYRAFMRLSKKHDNTLLLIAGGGRPDLEKLFSGKPNIILTGLKDNLAPYFQAMDVYVLPSLVETTSLTTMEAMATGAAVAVTPVGFIKEYVNDGENGLLFPKKDSYALFHILDYLKSNPEARLRLGNNARKTIIENYTWEKTVEGIKKVLESC